MSLAWVRAWSWLSSERARYRHKTASQRRKQTVHQQRARMAQRVIEDAASNPHLFHENVCPVCGQRGAYAFTNPIGFRFAQCPHDGAVYMDPVPTEDTLARLYNDDAYTSKWTPHQDEDAIKPGRALEYLRDVQRAMPQGRLLDVGCATGVFLEHARHAYEVEGVELNAATADMARARGLRVTTGRLADLPGEACFDVVTLLQVIEHIVDPAALLREVARLLAPGGVVYLNTPNVDSASFRLFRDRHAHVSSFVHVSLLTPRCWPTLAASAGLTMVEAGDCSTFDITAHDLISWHLRRRRFRHRMAMYSAALMSAGQTLDRVTHHRLTRAVAPRGLRSYQWAVLRKS
jgi:2-polyprenyl-3-methyl-5-hydroxy-6-metoxy-1,4-benzoquinol methylase